jgi:hypothetical protein
MRFVLAVDDDHSSSCAGSPTIRWWGGDRHLRGMRPLRTATSPTPAARAVAGQLITARGSGDPSGASSGSTRQLGELHGADLRRPRAVRTRRALPLRRSPARRTLVRLCRGTDLELLKGVDRGRRAGSSASAASALVGRVICLQGLGRYERGLARDLGLVKLASELWGRRVEAEETDALLEPYGEWAGIASVYLLAGYGSGLVGLRHENRDPRNRQDRRVAPRRAA